MCNSACLLEAQGFLSRNMVSISVSILLVVEVVVICRGGACICLLWMCRGFVRCVVQGNPPGDYFARCFHFSPLAFSYGARTNTVTTKANSCIQIISVKRENPEFYINV